MQSVPGSLESKKGAVSSAPYDLLNFFAMGILLPRDDLLQALLFLAAGLFLFIVRVGLLGSIRRRSVGLGRVGSPVGSVGLWCVRAGGAVSFRCAIGGGRRGSC